MSPVNLVLTECNKIYINTVYPERVALSKLYNRLHFPHGLRLCYVTLINGGFVVSGEVHFIVHDINLKQIDLISNRIIKSMTLKIFPPKTGRGVNSIELPFKIIIFPPFLPYFLDHIHY